MSKVVGNVRDGRFSNAVYLASLLCQFEGKTIEVSIRKHEPKRTASQNRLLWVVYGQAAAKSGHTAMDVHEFMSWENLSYETASGVRKKKSTSELTAKQMSEYIERVCYFFGLPVPGEDDDEF